MKRYKLTVAHTSWCPSVQVDDTVYQRGPCNCSPKHVPAEHPEGEWVRWADVEHLRITHANTIDTLQRSLRQFEVANRAAAMVRVPAEIKEAAAAARRNEEGVQAANALLTEEIDALKAEVERLKAERTQDVSIRREQCEALADSERGMFAAIDRHQMAAAEVERLRAALEHLVAASEFNSLLETRKEALAIAREALEKKP